MSLAGQIQNAVNGAFAALGDVPVSVTLRKLASADFDPVTGTGAQTPTDTTFEAVRTEDKVNTATDGRAPIIRRRWILKADNGVVPAVGDRLIYNGKELPILEVSASRAGATDLVYEAWVEQ